jgi:hypothetical protein
VNSFDKFNRLTMTESTSLLKHSLREQGALRDEMNMKEARTSGFPSYFCDFHVESSKDVSIFRSPRAAGASLAKPRFHWVPAFVAIL